MLERTASSLESCSLQRVLAKSTRSTSRSRPLHTAFWQHGASAIELGGPWPTPTSLPASQPVDLGSPQDSSLVASAFLLDFLYPSASRTLLRRLHPGPPRARDGRGSSTRLRRRGFTSSFIAQQKAAKELDEAEAASPVSIPPPSSLSKDQIQEGDGHTATASIPAHVDGSQKFDTSLVEATQIAGLDVTEPDHTIDTNKLASLEGLLSNPEEARYLDVWDAYTRVPQESKPSFRVPVVIYLSKSSRDVEGGRATMLSQHVPLEDWTNEFLSAVILIHVRRGRLDIAIDKFTTGVESCALSGGLEYLLTHTVFTKQWELVLKLWLLHYESVKQRDRDSSPDLSSLDCLSQLPDLSRLYISFERYMATHGVEADIEIETSSISATGIGLLRRMFAETALEQSCPPNQAAVILESCRSGKLYYNYIIRMLRRLRAKEELKSNLTKLGDIYRAYRQLPNVLPNDRILHGMFDFMFPEDRPGIELIYQDWLKNSGSLDSRAHEQFLKFHAKAGNIKAVKVLWKQWITKFPHVLDQGARAFGSILNVYAQVGDADGLERELKMLSDEYGYKPGTVARNLQLKGYAKSGDYDKALQCFKQICDEGEANSFTYTHALMIAAKKGDLDSSLAMLNMASSSGITLSPQMCFGLIWTYCERNELETAERVCTQLTKRGLADAKAWNTLLHFYGMQGQLKKCHAMFDNMKELGVEWDGETYEFLLQAMVNVGQVSTAFNFLRQAHERKLFTLQPQHFTAIMGKTAQLEPTRVEALKDLMEKAGIPATFAIQVTFLQAAHRREPHSVYARGLRKQLIESLRAMVPKAEERGGRQGKSELQESARTDVSRGVRELRRETHNIGRAILLLAEARDFEAAEELVTVYMQLFPQHKDVESFGPDVVSALMEGYVLEGSYERVHALWEKVWQRALVGSQLPNESGIHAARQYDLCRPVKAMVRTFQAQNDGHGLLELIRQVESTGFKLTSSVWNLAIRELGYMGQLGPAMEWYERLMMPLWRGWGTIFTTPEQKRELRNTRILRPSQNVVLVLQSKWLEMRKLAAWSPNVSRELRDIQTKYPTLHTAFSQADFSDFDGQWLIDGKVDLENSIDKWLAKMPRSRLRAAYNYLKTSLLRVKQTKKAENKADLRRRNHEERGHEPDTSNVAQKPASQEVMFPSNLTPEQQKVLFGLVSEELTENNDEASTASDSSKSPDAVLQSLKKELAQEKLAEGRPHARKLRFKNFKKGPGKHYELSEPSTDWTRKSDRSRPTGGHDKDGPGEGT